MRALAKNPADRHQSCNEFLEDLRNSRAAGRKANVIVAAPPPPIAEQSSRSPLLSPRRLTSRRRCPRFQGFGIKRGRERQSRIFPESIHSYGVASASLLSSYSDSSS